MKNKKYVFVGNREYVLKEMIELKLNIVETFVIENSFLHNTLKSDKFIEYKVVTSKRQLLRSLKDLEYDILISNGCKYILPVNSMNEAKYVNIHPSYLPDLPGKDPINGAILYGRDGGATCHLMDEGIDTGDIISRKKINYSYDIDAGLLFQLSFMLEKEVFHMAINKDFKPLDNQPKLPFITYYSMNEKDQYINFDVDVNGILRQVKAFNYSSKGLFFRCGNKKYIFFGAKEITNLSVINMFENSKELEVLLSFENSILFKKSGRLLQFNNIVEKDEPIKVGDIIASYEIS